jgi:hypothetical protein
MPGIAKTQQLLKEQFGNVNDKVRVVNSLQRVYVLKGMAFANSSIADSTPA